MNDGPPLDYRPPGPRKPSFTWLLLAVPLLFLRPPFMARFLWDAVVAVGAIVFVAIVLGKRGRLRLWHLWVGLLLLAVMLAIGGILLRRIINNLGGPQ